MLLDDSVPFDESKVELFDEVVNALYGVDNSVVSFQNNLSNHLSQLYGYPMLDFQLISCLQN